MLCHLAVAQRRFLECLDLVIAQTADNLRRIPVDQGVRRDLAVPFDHRAGTDDDILADDRVAHDDGAHTDERVVADALAVDDGVVTDDDALADCRRMIVHHMDGRILLDVRVLADLDGLKVAADDGAEPHAHTLFNRDIAGDNGRRCQKDALVNLRCSGFIGHDDCHIDSPSRRIYFVLSVVAYLFMIYSRKKEIFLP